MPRESKQVPFWDKNKGFANLKKPVLYNLRKDQAETTNVAADNPEVVHELMQLAGETRKELGEFMQRGASQRPTGTLFPNVPVISHEKDWDTLGSETSDAIAAERKTRHPDYNKRTKKKNKKK